ncbi:MAG: hypothetical protein RR623_08950 [Bacilli bacterium]
MKKSNTKIICKNTFKNEDRKQRKEEFNKKWIELINLREKSKVL